MNQKKAVIMLVSALAIIVGVFAVIHFTSLGTVPEGAIEVRVGDEATYVNPVLLDRCDVKGTIKNDSGEEIALDTEGFPLRDVLAAAKVNPQTITAVTVTTKDGQSAALTGDEARAADKVFLYPDENGAAALAVFGDSDGSRGLHGVVSLDVQA